MLKDLKKVSLSDYGQWPCLGKLEVYYGVVFNIDVWTIDGIHFRVGHDPDRLFTLDEIEDLIESGKYLDKGVRDGGFL